MTEIQPHTAITYQPEEGNDMWYADIGSCDSLVPPDNKPLPEPIVSQIRVAIWCYLGHNGFVTYATANCLDEFKGPLRAHMGFQTSYYSLLVGVTDMFIHIATVKSLI